MAGTQELPSWMTLSIVTITNSEGIPVTTSTTTLQLPLTYYGPSIPLGTDGAWTWGGLYPPTSSPSAVASPTATPVVPSSTFTATPLTSSSFSHSTSTPTSTPPTSTAPTTTTAATSASASPVAAFGLSKGELIGIIFGAILAFILFLLLLVWVIRWRIRRQRNGFRLTPIWTHWEVLSPSGQRSTDGDRPPGVGSPRGSGEEIDPFLQQSRSGNVSQRHRSARAVASLPPGAAPPMIGSTSGGSRHTKSSASTDYGELLPDTGRVGQAYADDGDPYLPVARASSEMIGHIIPPGELLRIDDEEEPVSPPRMYDVSRAEDSDPLLPPFTPLSPPPPLDIERYSSRRASSVNEKEKSLRSLSYPASDMEASEVVTARRVRVRDVRVRAPEGEGTSPLGRFETGPVAGPSSWRSSLGGSLQRLRQSWFGGPSRHTSYSSNGLRVRSDDIESSQSLLQSSRSRPRSGLGLVIGSDRPISTFSTRSAVSGHTVYHDAASHLGTPVSVPSRAMTPATGGGVVPGNEAPPPPTSAPPAYTLEDPYDSMGSRTSFPYPQDVDVLDLPVPTPASQFTASGGASRGTPPSAGGQAQQRSFGDSLSDITGSSNEAGITIDVLDAEPPRAGEGWRTMAEGLLGGRGSGSDNGGRRTTFGMPHQRQATVSEQGSLHSIRSYLSPHSRSSASDSGPGSRHSNGHTGSASSRPSAQSRVPTASSGSLRSGSFSRLRGGGSGLPVSPALSAFGLVNEPSPLSPLAMSDLPSPISRGSAYYSAHSSDNGGFSRVSVLGPMPSFTAHSVLAPTIRSVGATTTSDETEVTRTTVTAGTGTTGSGGSGPETTDDLVERLRLGDFDMGRLRL